MKVKCTEIWNCSCLWSVVTSCCLQNQPFRGEIWSSCGW